MHDSSKTSFIRQANRMRNKDSTISPSFAMNTDPHLDEMDLDKCDKSKPNGMPPFALFKR